MFRSLRCAFAAGASLLLIGGIAGSVHADLAIRSPTPNFITGRLATHIRLGDGLRTYHPSLHQLGVRYAPGQSDKTPSDQVQYVVNRAVLRRYLLALARVVRRHPVDARPVLAVHNAPDSEQEVPARILPGHDGAVLEVDAAVNVIQKALEADARTQHIVLPLKTTPAKVTAHDLAGIDGRIAYFATRFDPYNVGRTMTVRKAIGMVNGTVVKPGATFSLNQTVGPRDPAHGFTGKSDVFIDGKMAIQNGGGMCQVATTLFNAAMLGDLKITERHQHMRTIPYAPPGSDATVYYGEKDLKFTNDTDAPIYIAFHTTEFHAIVALYGKMIPGRRVKIIRHWDQIAERHVTGSIDRVVHEPNGVVERGPYFFSNYKWTSALDF